MAAFTEWVQQVLHRECDTVIDCHDQARAASAQAHHEAEQALADERERTAAAEAGRCGEEQMAAHMRQLAGLYRDRLLRAQELLVQEADRACDPVAAATAVSAA